MQKLINSVLTGARKGKGNSAGKNARKAALKVSLVLWLVAGTAGWAWGQSAVQDLTLLQKHQPAQQAPTEHTSTLTWPGQSNNSLKWGMQSALTVYQRVISPQITAACIYETSCSRYGRQAIAQLGFVHGLLATADRLGRCNRVHYTETSPLRRNAQGRIIESPKDYLD